MTRGTEVFSAEARRLLALRLAGRARASCPIGPRAGGNSGPLHPAQSGYWAVEQTSPDAFGQRILIAWAIGGFIPGNVIERALREVVARYETLRTTFRVEGGRPVQVVSEDVLPQISVRDMRGAEDPHEEVERHVDALWNGPLPLDTPPWRLAVLRTGEREQVFLLLIHHIVCDRVGIDRIISELGALCRAAGTGVPVHLGPPGLQPLDVVAWLEGDGAHRLDAALAYWHERLRGARETSRFPLDRPVEPPRAGAGDTVDYQVPTATRHGLRRLAADEGTTLFAACLAAFAIELAAAARSPNVVVGVPVAGRPHQEIETIVGCFCTTLPLRLELAECRTFREVLRHTHGRVLEALEHQELPTDRLAHELDPLRDASLTPLFQVVFRSHDVLSGWDDFAGYPARDVPLAVSFGQPTYDVVVSHLDGAAFEGAWTYGSDILDRATVERLVSKYLERLEVSVRSPDERLVVGGGRHGDEPSAFAFDSTAVPEPLEPDAAEELLRGRR